MHQVMPGSPVTAIVGSQLGQTAPNNVPVWFDRRFAPDPTDQTRILAGEQLINPQKGTANGLPGEESVKGSTTWHGIKLLPGNDSVTGIREQFTDATRDLFRDRPELEGAYYTAFKGAYAQLLAEKGDYSGTGDFSLMHRALKMVIGSTTTVNGRTVAVPLGMEPGRFQSILDAAIDVKARAAGVADGYQDKIRGYQPIEIGGLGSGRYQLANGNAPLVNPDGKGLFIVDLRNQYMAAAGAKPAPADAARMAAEQPVAPPTVAEVGGQAGVPKGTSGAEPTFKAPPVTGTARGGRGNGRTHPSQGEVDAE
jgi:hypothetical protein